MKQLKEIAGYLIGGLLFVALIPAVMWLASEMPVLGHVGATKAIIIGILMLAIIEGE